MRKFLILFVLCSLNFSCSLDDDDSPKPSTDFILNPPEWLQGSWKFQQEDESEILIEVLDDNVKIFSFGGAVVHDVLGNPKSAISKANHTATLEETFPSSSEYAITVKVFNENTQTQNMVYKFNLLESGAAEFDLNNYTVQINRIEP